MNEIKYIIDIQYEKCSEILDSLLDAESELSWTVNNSYDNICIKIKELIEKEPENNNNNMINSLNTLGDKNLLGSNVFIPKNNSLFNSMNDSSKSSIYEVNELKIPSTHIDLLRQISSKKDEQENSISHIQIKCFAYWNIVNKRFSDYFNMTCLKYIVKYFTKELENQIEMKYSPSVNENNHSLISESHSISIKRSKLRTDIKNLNEALLKIQKVFL